MARSKRNARPEPGAPMSTFNPAVATAAPKRSPTAGAGWLKVLTVVPSTRYATPLAPPCTPSIGAPTRTAVVLSTARAAPKRSPDTAGDGGVRVRTMAPNVWLARSPSIRNTAPAFGAPLPSPGAPSSSATPGVEGFSKVRPSLNARVVVVVEVDVVVVVVADGRVVVVVEDVVVVVGA